MCGGTDLYTVNTILKTRLKRNPPHNTPGNANKGNNTEMRTHCGFWEYSWVPINVGEYIKLKAKLKLNPQHSKAGNANKRSYTDMRTLCCLVKYFLWESIVWINANTKIKHDSKKNENKT